MDYSRNWLFISRDQQVRLSNIKVLLIGCGLGSYIATSLARLGVSNFIIADGDNVEESNLNRQIYDQSNIGQNKAKALGEKLRAINPKVNQIVLPIFLEEEDLHEWIPRVDIVINAIDFDNPVFAKCNELVKNYKKVEIFSINLGFGACTMVFNDKTPSLTEYFPKDNLKFSLLSWIVKNSNKYLQTKFQEYGAIKEEVKDPQLVVGSLLNSGFVCKVITDLIAQEKVLLFPDKYEVYLP